MVQGLHGHQPRSTRRGDPGGARARAESDGAPLFGVVPRGGRAGDRQPRARAVHEQRLRAEPHAGSLRAKPARQLAAGVARRPGNAEDHPRDGGQQGGHDFHARGVRAVVPQSPAARGSRARGAVPRGARGVPRGAQGDRRTRGAVHHAGGVSPRAGVRARVREGRWPARRRRGSHRRGWGAAGLRRPAQLRAAARGRLRARRRRSGS